MGVRLRKNGKIVNAAINEPEEGDYYIDDRMLQELSDRDFLVTTYFEEHMESGGEWWWKGEEPSNLKIDYAKK